MARASPIFSITCFCLFLLVQQLADGQTKKCPPWCVSKHDASMDRVKMSLDWICKNGANCGPISPGGPCHVKGDLKAMASYAFNDYFQKTRVSGGLCDYGEVATLSNSDPSHGPCKFTCTPY
ncbi:PLASMODESMATA CALLOSE-BINDING PROTEIN 5-like isoform X2 [Amaranthus tricolor]|uniref:PLASMODESMATA CALLOSE-BINDING PROTEIN 5-like isoform X2 n=1 Tax=Amaranthus tricolor TaxID=29722 RepID=UPI00258ADAEE|nr:PLASMODESMATA CALLOSE-BINDING PROTEIN 5-like isoform X2 [Amaranthus tricolor]